MHNWAIGFTHYSGVIYGPLVCSRRKMSSGSIKMQPLGFLVVKCDSLYIWLWHSTSYSINDNNSHSAHSAHVSMANWLRALEVAQASDLLCNIINF